VTSLAHHDCLTDGNSGLMQSSLVTKARTRDFADVLIMLQADTGQ